MSPTAETLTVYLIGALNQACRATSLSTYWPYLLIGSRIIVRGCLDLRWVIVSSTSACGPVHTASNINAETIYGADGLPRPVTQISRGNGDFLWYRAAKKVTAWRSLSSLAFTWCYMCCGGANEQGQRVAVMSVKCCIVQSWCVYRLLLPY